MILLADPKNMSQSEAVCPEAVYPEAVYPGLPNNPDKSFSKGSSISPNSHNHGGLKSPRGANLLEYSLLLLLILVGAVLSLNMFSDNVSQRFSSIASAVGGL